MPLRNLPPYEPTRFAVSALALPRGTNKLGPITFSLPQPGCYWLTGVSGAGKSLLLESLAGFHAGATGSICLNQSEVGNLAPEHRSIALMPQRFRLFPHWTVARNLHFSAKLSASSPDRIQQLAKEVQITALLDRPVRGLSGGETQRIALIQTLISPAKVLLLDEPISAIDSALQSVVIDVLQHEAAENNRIIFIAAHEQLPAHPMQGSFHLERGQLAAAS